MNIKRYKSEVESILLPAILAEVLNGRTDDLKLKGVAAYRDLLLGLPRGKLQSIGALEKLVAALELCPESRVRSQVIYYIEKSILQGTELKYL